MYGIIGNIQLLTPQNAARPLLDHRLGLCLLHALRLLHLFGQLALVLPELVHRIVKLAVIVQHLTHIVHIILGNN